MQFKFKKEEKYLSVIVLLNEPNIDKTFFSKLNEILSNNFLGSEIVLVNNTTFPIKEDDLRFLEALTPKIMLVALSYKHDIESAMLAGIDIAIGDLVVEVENNSEESISAIMDLYKKSKEGYDIVSAGSKKINFLERMFFFLFNLFSSQDIKINKEHIRIVSRRALNNLLSYRDFHPYRKLLYQLSGYKTFHLRYKTSFPKNRSLVKDLIFAMNILNKYTNFPVILASIICCLFILFGIAMSIYTIYSFMYFNGIRTGWASLMLTSLVSFSMIFFIFIMILRYLHLINSQLQGNSRYIVKSTEILKGVNNKED